jgi:serine/threonine-protein kinase
MMPHMVDPERDATVAGVGAERGPSAAPDADEELAAGTAVGAWVVRRLLGSGGHGSVYLAEHAGSAAPVALKVLHRRAAESEEMRSRFAREVEVVNAIRHPNVVAVHGVGTLRDGRPWCAMELLRGTSLRELVGARGPLSLPEAIAILEPVCAALAAAHERGVVHRDVKGSNVLVDEGPPLTVKLIDFGVAKWAAPGAPGLTVAGQRLGTIACMAPEQIRGGAVDARTDVYALGVLLFQLVTGTLPFPSSDPLDLERAHLEAPPPRPSAVAPVPPALDAVVARSMAKRPEERHESVGAFLAALREAAGARPAAGGERAVPAVAIHLVVEPREGAADDALVAAADAVEAAGASLRAAGWSAALTTSESVLAVRPLPPEASAARAACAAAIALARDLHVAASRAGDGLRVAVAVHVAEALVRAGPSGPEVAGGPACDTAGWGARAEGVAVTPAAAAAAA